MASRIHIAGTGWHLPPAKITNADLIASLETTDDWIVSHTGIRERRRAAEDVNTSGLGAEATRDACARAGWDLAELDLLVCATSTPDSLIPATASYICQQLGIEPVAFDVNAACSGFVYGLATARGLMSTMGYRRVAMVTAEKYTRVTDYRDRSTAVFFGDSAGCVLLQEERPQVGLELVDLEMANMNEGAHLVTTPIGQCFRQDGRKVKEYALRGFRDSALAILGRAGLAAADLKAFVGHQANLRVLELVAGELGVRPDQHWFNVDVCGNQGAAGVATTFCERTSSARNGSAGNGGAPGGLSDGDWILATVFGSGFTTGSALMRWVDGRA